MFLIIFYKDKSEEEERELEDGLLRQGDTEKILSIGSWRRRDVRTSSVVMKNYVDEAPIGESHVARPHLLLVYDSFSN